MENRPIGPEEQDDTSDSASIKKKRGSTLSRYLSALRGKEVAKDESSESNTEKPKRVQRLFKRLFPGIVERPAHLSSEEENTQEYDFNHEAWFGWARQARQGESIQPTVTPEETTSSVEVGDEVAPIETEKVDTIEQSKGIEELPELSDETPATPDVATREPLEIDNRLDLLEQQSNPQYVEQQQGEIPLRPSTEAETIIERRGSNLLPVALVGAEYFGRKRADKKLESRVDKKIDASSEKQIRSEALQKELEQVVAQNKQQIEQLKEARVSMERKVTEVADRKEVVPRAALIAERKPAASPEVRRIEQTSFPAEAIKPRNIAEKVADAAEHDVPVERAFERSHEVKDDIPVTTGAAASVGAVMAANAAVAGLTPINQATSSKTPQTDKNLPFVSDADIAAAYKQAAKAGFWTAICVIILGVIAYLVVRYI